MPDPKVWIVVLNWRDAEATAACLASIGASDYRNFRIVVIDNASTDGSVERFVAMVGIDVIRNSTNLGFTGGVNLGIRQAIAGNADYVWLLNSDATLEPETLSRLVAAAEADPSIGLVSPIFCSPSAPGTVEFCLGRFDPASRTTEQTADIGVARQWLRDSPKQIVVLGTALLIRRALIEAIGGLDDQYFAYVEDVDYSLRSLTAGFRNVVEPGSIVYHQFKTPTENPSDCPPHLHYYMSRNYPLLWRKHFGSFVFRRSTIWFLHQRLLQVRRLGRDEVGVAALLAGLWDGFIGRGGPFNAERQMPWPIRMVMRVLGAVWLRGVVPSGHAGVP